MKSNFHYGKILSRNKILTITKCHNCVVNLWKLTCNHPNLDLVNINAYTKFGQIQSIYSQDIEQKQNFDQIPSICSQDTERKQILTITKSHNSVVNLRKLMCINPNVDLVNVNAYAKFGLILSIHSQDIEEKPKFWQ